MSWCNASPRITSAEQDRDLESSAARPVLWPGVDHTHARSLFTLAAGSSFDAAFHVLHPQEFFTDSILWRDPRHCLVLQKNGTYDLAAVQRPRSSKRGGALLCTKSTKDVRFLLSVDPERCRRNDAGLRSDGCGNARVR